MEFLYGAHRLYIEDKHNLIDVTSLVGIKSAAAEPPIESHATTLAESRLAPAPTTTRIPPTTLRLTKKTKIDNDNLIPLDPDAFLYKYDKITRRSTASNVAIKMLSNAVLAIVDVILNSKLN